jgi:hypothetical protein
MPRTPRERSEHDSGSARRPVQHGRHADRAFFRDILEFPFVAAGHDWLSYARPPAHIAMHPADTAGHEMLLMSDDVETFAAQMSERGVACPELRTQRWGSITELALPSRGTLRVHQPAHPSPPNAA